jgi:hypothetical protein
MSVLRELFEVTDQVGEVGMLLVQESYRTPDFEARIKLLRAALQAFKSGKDPSLQLTASVSSVALPRCHMIELPATAFILFF